MTSSKWASEIRAEFSHQPGSIFLNSGSLSRSPRAVVDAVIDETRRAELNPTEYLFSAWERLWQSQIRLAEFLGARPEDLFLRPNVSSSMNEFILGVPLKAQGEILLSSQEYGAMENLCRYRAERSGLSLRKLSLPAEPRFFKGATEGDIVDLVTSSLREETRLIMLSHVMTGTGLVMPVRKLAAECRRRGVILAVDGAHGPGALPLNFSELADLDFYGGNIHKWMMGPKGTGFGWVNPRHQEVLLTNQAGWTTFETPSPFAKFAPGSRFAQRMLPGSVINFAPYFALVALFSWWKRWDGDQIRARIYGLHRHLIPRLESEGWTILSPANEAMRGPLVTVDLPAPLASLGYELMFRLQREYGVTLITPFVDGKFRLRFSPHVYNTEGELDAGVTAISRLRASLQ